MNETNSLLPPGRTLGIIGSGVMGKTLPRRNVAKIKKRMMVPAPKATTSSIVVMEGLKKHLVCQRLRGSAA